jgi:tetratricopeptide (TPR) repeat protein
MTSISPVRLALVVLLAGSVAGNAQAQPAQPDKPKSPDNAGAPADPSKESPALTQARALFVEGEAHYQAGRYVLAAERFLKAYELSGKPALLFNLANTYERAGDYEKAAKYLRLYLDGGEVHDVTSVRARLQRLELAASEQKKNAEAAKNADTNTTPASAPAAVDAPVTKDRPSRVPYYVAGGGVVVGVAATLAFGLRARSERSEIASLCADQAGGMICPPEAESHLNSERRYALLSDIGIGVAAASAATGLIYYLATRDSGADREPSHQALSIVPSAGGVGFVATGRF